MSTTQNTSKAYAFIDYRPAELRKNKRWEVVYFVKDEREEDIKQQWKRYRIRVKPMLNTRDRTKYGLTIAQNINEKLKTGWKPWYSENNAKAYTKLTEVIDLFLKETEKRFAKKEIRKDTVRAYRSYLKNFSIWLQNEGKENLLINKYNEQLIRSFLNEIYFERDNSATTHNNYLSFFGNFTKWLIRRKYLKIDCTASISSLREGVKKRTVFPDTLLKAIFEELKRTNKGYYVLCMTAYYCLIRRTELTKLKVEDVYLKNGIINIPSNVSKNGKNQVVTIPNELINHLANHLSKANNTDFLFSNNNFLPGTNQLRPKKISDTFAKYRKKMNFENCYQWYSFKDTGITNYLKQGIPTIDVKNQARHSTITQTETYIPKSIYKAVDNIKNIKLKHF